MAAKPFEVGDVLPATTQLKISWSFSFEDDEDPGDIWITVYVNNETFGLCDVFLDHTLIPSGFIDINEELVYSGGSWVSPYTSSSGNHNYIIIDTSSWTESERTVAYIQIYMSDPGEGPFYWEDLNAPSGYTITFNSNGGSSVTSISDVTELPDTLPTPTKENHTFLGWYYDSDFTNEAHADDPLTGDVTLYARWGLNSGPKNFEVGEVLPATTQLRISWETDDLSLRHDKKVKTNSYNFYLIESIANYDVWINGVKIWDEEDWAFEEPFTGITGGHNYIDINTSSWPKEKRTLSIVYLGSYHSTIYWEDLNASSGYTITFNSHGGTTFSNIEEATELPTLPTPTKSGYTFVAWYYESNFQTRAKAGDTIESNVTLYAKWHNLGSLFTEIADAIRSKDGTSENIRDVDFGERINSLKTYEVVETLAELELLEPKLNRLVYVKEGSGELAMGEPVKVTQDGDTLIIG